MKNKVVQVSSYVPYDIYERLNQLAQGTQRSLSFTIHDAVCEYIARREQVTAQAQVERINDL